MSIKIGIVGYGYWGPNLVRNFNVTDGCEVTAVCDLDEKRLDQARKDSPASEMFTDFDTFLRHDLDAIAISTPVSSHFPLALQALETGKHVLIEKPMAESSEQAERLIEAAELRNLTLMVDHTFIYTGAVRKIHQLYQGGELGKMHYFDSTRINLGLYQHDVDVIWDLAVHDLSILDFVIGETPTSVSAVGASHVPGMPEDMAYLTVFYESNALAHVNVNWLSPVKVRRTIIGGSKKMIVWDDLEPSDKIKVYDAGIILRDESEEFHNLIVSYRVGDMWAPKIPMAEALAVEARHFVDCINNNQAPLTSGERGLRVVQILEAASQSMKKRGAPVDVVGARS